jgi:hypothetical protein
MYPGFVSAKFIPAYLVLFAVFCAYFKIIPGKILKDRVATPHVIDAHIGKPPNIVDMAYVMSAKEKGYDIPAYKRMYFPADMIFPIIYSLLFFACTRILKVSWLCNALIIAGAFMDYFENIAFFIFITDMATGTALLVSWLTVIKIVIFVSNIILSTVGLFKTGNAVRWSF